MRIAYESTIDEATESALRVTEIVGAGRTWRWAGLIWTPFIFVPLFLLLDDLAAKIVVGSVASGLFAVYWLSNYKNVLRKRLRRVLIKTRGTDRPVPSEYELSNDGIVFRQFGQELRFSWVSVAGVKVTETSIDVKMTPAGIAVIPTRIFGSPQEQKSWVAFIHEHTRRDEQLSPSQSGYFREA
jgi:hypothetical protein